MKRWLSFLFALLAASAFAHVLGRHVVLADPDLGLWQHGYDLAGRLNVQTDAKGQQLKFLYNDPAGRLTRREGWNAAGQLDSVENMLSGGEGSGGYIYNIILSAGFGTLLPGRGFKDIYQSSTDPVPGFDRTDRSGSVDDFLYSALLAITLTY
jgi:YD repeat-containing protein